MLAIRTGMSQVPFKKTIEYVLEESHIEKWIYIYSRTPGPIGPIIGLWDNQHFRLT